MINIRRSTCTVVADFCKNVCESDLCYNPLSLCQHAFPIQNVCENEKKHPESALPMSSITNLTSSQSQLCPGKETVEAWVQPHLSTTLNLAQGQHPLTTTSNVLCS